MTYDSRHWREPPTMSQPETWIFPKISEMKKARASLGSPAALNESLVATGIDAFFSLLDGGVVVVEGKAYQLTAVRVTGENPQEDK